VSLARVHAAMTRHKTAWPDHLVTLHFCYVTKLITLDIFGSAQDLIETWYLGQMQHPGGERR
jgi:hypothetical protein